MFAARSARAIQFSINEFPFHIRQLPRVVVSHSTSYRLNTRGNPGVDRTVGDAAPFRFIPSPSTCLHSRGQNPICLRAGLTLLLHCRNCLCVRTTIGVYVYKS